MPTMWSGRPPKLLKRKKLPIFISNYNHHFGSKHPHGSQFFMLWRNCCNRTISKHSSSNSPRHFKISHFSPGMNAGLHPSSWSLWSKSLVYVDGEKGSEVYAMGWGGIGHELTKVGEAVAIWLVNVREGYSRRLMIPNWGWSGMDLHQPCAHAPHPSLPMPSIHCILFALALLSNYHTISLSSPLRANFHCFSFVSSLSGSNFWLSTVCTPFQCNSKSLLPFRSRPFVD